MWVRGWVAALAIEPMPRCLESQPRRPELSRAKLADSNSTLRIRPGDGAFEGKAWSMWTAEVTVPRLHLPSCRCTACSALTAPMGALVPPLLAAAATLDQSI